MAQPRNIKRKAIPDTAKSKAKHKKSGVAIIAAISALVVIIAVVLIAGNLGDNNSIIKDSDLTIQKSEITEKARFYPVEIDGTKLEVIAVRASDNTIRTAFNTCQVCYSSGRGFYKQEGNVLVCQNCGNRFGTDDVEVTRGGCNPVPITEEGKTVTETGITISKEYLSQAKVIFENWKR